jgi:hypothetical protein
MPDHDSLSAHCPRCRHGTAPYPAMTWPCPCRDHHHGQAAVPGCCWDLLPEFVVTREMAEENRAGRDLRSGAAPLIDIRDVN